MKTIKLKDLYSFLVDVSRTTALKESLQLEVKNKPEGIVMYHLMLPHLKFFFLEEKKICVQLDGIRYFVPHNIVNVSSDYVVDLICFFNQHPKFITYHHFINRVFIRVAYVYHQNQNKIKREQMAL